MIRIAAILLYFGASSLSLIGQQALSDNVNGQWCIYSNGEKVNLDHSIHELGNFDELGLTFFMQYEKYGIINEKGIVVLEQKFSSIKQLGGGYYLLLDDEKKQILANFGTDQIELREVNNLQKLQTSWYTARFDTTHILINSHGQKEWIFSGQDEVIESDFKYVYCEINGQLRLFDPQGNDVNIQKRNPTFAQQYLLLINSDRIKIIYRNYEIDLPNDATNIRIREQEILYAQTDKSTIISSIDGRKIVEFPFNDVRYYNDNLLVVLKNGKFGLVNKSGKVLIPPKYVSISVLGGLYYVRTESGGGILDKNGKELLPCKYSYIVAYRDFFEVHNRLDFLGLVSRKTGKTILPTNYSKLKLNDSIVRGFSGDMLRIIKLDSNHRILNDIVLSNVTSLVHTRASSNTNVDERLFPLGWFIKNVPQYDSLGFLKDQVPRWGLKGANDSVLIPARHKEPIFVDQADFSLIASPTKMLNLNGMELMSFTQFQVTSHITGKRLIPEPVLTIDTLDLLSRDYVRFVSEKGNGVLLSDNSILRVNYIDGDDSRFVRFCTSKANTEMLPADRKDYDALRFFDFDLNNDPSNWEQIYLKGKPYNFIRFNNAEWNFLDTNGKKVFNEPFDFAQPYLYETALVEKDGKWGVARADSFAIPVKYASIKRSPVSDTLFIVKRKSGGTRFLDTNGRLMTNGMTRFYSNKENFSQVEIGGYKKIIAPDYSIISGDSHFQKLFDNNIFFSKKNKDYAIYDQLGTQLGAVRLRPEEVLFERYVLAKSRGKRGLLSMDSDTLLPFIYKEITQLGNYIFARDGVDNRLFDQNLSLVQRLKSNDVLVDSISGNYAVISDGKATTFSSLQKKLGKFKGSKFKHFHNGYLIEIGKELRIYGSENEFTFDFQPKELQLMSENGYLVIDSKKNGHYFDLAWKEITFDTPLKRAKVVGEGLAIARSRKGTLLFGGDVAVDFKLGTRSNGTFRNGFLLLERSKDYQFVDVNGINKFKRTFDDAKPFSGKYATVKEKGGWTIIDGKGHFQILPGFDKITPLSQSIFSTSAQALFGLFDAHGNELIPVEFQELHFLRNDIIQGRKNGRIFYFDRNGTSISLDLF